MSQQKKKLENESLKKNKKKASTRAVEVPFAFNCNLCKIKDTDTYVSRRVEDKLALCLTKQSSLEQSKPEKEQKKLNKEKVISRKAKKSKRNEKSDCTLDVPVCNTSPALSDKTTDSDLIVISEADSGSSNKISPSSDYSSNSFCSDHIYELPSNNNLLSSDIRTENVCVPQKSKCSISITLNEYNLDPTYNELLPYEDTFAATLPHLEVNYESDFSDFMESSRIQNGVKDTSNLDIDSNKVNENILIKKSQEIMPAHCNVLPDVDIPNYSSPKNSFLSYINNVNSVCDTKENFNSNQLGIKPLIKPPPNFTYEENNFSGFSVDIAMLRAANNYYKERSTVQTISSPPLDISGSHWKNSIIKFDDPYFNLSGNLLNQFISEDNESEISISSCKTSDIQPEFFDSTFSEIFEENISEENASHLNSVILSPKTKTNDVCVIPSTEEKADKAELYNTNKTKIVPETNTKAKRKRKRCIWDTKKRKCKRKKKDAEPELTNELNTNNDSELNAEDLCDTCDESEIEDDETVTKFSSKSSFQEKELPSKTTINTNTEQNTKDSRVGTSCNEPIESTGVEQNKQLRKEKINTRINVKRRELEDQAPSTIVRSSRSRKNISADLCLKMKDDNFDVSVKEPSNNQHTYCNSTSDKLNNKLLGTISHTVTNKIASADDATRMKFLTDKSNERDDSSEINMNSNTNNKNILEDSEINDMPCHELLKSTGTGQSTQVREENSPETQKLNVRRNVKRLDLESATSSTMIRSSRSRKNTSADLCLKMKDKNVDQSVKAPINNQQKYCSTSNKFNNKLLETISNTVTNESAIADDAIHMEFLVRKSTERDDSSEININSDANQNISDENKAPSNELVKSTEAGHSIQIREKNCPVTEKMNKRRNVKRRDLEDDTPSTIVRSSESRRNTSADLCLKIKDNNVGHLVVKAYTNKQDINCYSTSNESSNKFCETRSPINESAVAGDATHTKFLNDKSTRQNEYSSKVSINHDTTQNISEDSKTNEASCKQFEKVSDAKQDIQMKDQNSYTVKKLNPKVYIKELVMETEDFPTVIVSSSNSINSDFSQEINNNSINYLSVKACTGSQDSQSLSISSGLNDNTFEMTSSTKNSENVIQEKKNSPEINIDHETIQNITANIDKVGTSYNQFKILKDVKQNTQLKKGNSNVKEKLISKKKHRKQDMETEKKGKKQDIETEVPSKIILSSGQSIHTELQKNNKVEYLSLTGCTGNQDSDCFTTSDRFDDNFFEMRSSSSTSESEAKIDATCLELFKQRKKNSSELNITHDTKQYSKENSEKIGISCNQFVKLNNAEQATQLRKENSNVIEKLNSKKNVKEQVMEADVSPAEKESSGKSISLDLCQEVEDNIDYSSVKPHSDVKNSIYCSATNKLNEKTLEVGSPTRTETIILGLTEDDLDFEFDPQDDTDNSSDCSGSFFKFSNCQQNSFEAFPETVIQDGLNSPDSNRNSKENPFSSSNNLQEIVLNDYEQGIYSSYNVDVDDDDSDSDKDYCFKRSHERTNSILEPSENISAPEKINVSSKVPENYEPLTKNLDGKNLSSITDKLHEPSLSSSGKGTNEIENDMTKNSNKSTEVSSETSRSLDDVIFQIKEYCLKEKGVEAVEVANTYISISCTDYVNKIIFKNLLFGLFSFIKKIVNVEATVSKVFDDVFKLLLKFEIYDKKLSSSFIIKCLEYPELNDYLKKMFDCCKDKNIPLSRNAINAFNSILKTEELTFSVLLDYIQYIKSVCNKKIPKNLLHSALKKFKTGKFPEKHRLCCILYGVTSKEIDELNLKEFLQDCFKESMWPYVAEMFWSWCTKNNLSSCIYTALASESEFMAKYYEKFAKAVHKDDNDQELCLQHKLMFGQIGTALMLEAFDKKYLDCAFEILTILHKFNVNYYDLELAFYKIYSSGPFSDANSFHVKILPFKTVFYAVDICLHFERPNDAFTIFQDFSWVAPNESMDQELQLYILKERYHRLIKLVPLLNDKESLHKGWEALKILLTAVEQGLVEKSFKEENQDYIEEKLENTDANKTTGKTQVDSMRSIYNDYMISLINFEELSSAYDLYEHSFGPKKDILTVKPDVLRGLVVAFCKSGKTEMAKSIFMQGLFSDVYAIKKPDLSSAPWNLTVRCEWTIHEIKFVIDWFISMISPLLAAKPKDTNFEEWFSLKLMFKVTSQQNSKIKCLNDSGNEPKYYINKTKSALQSMNPSLQFTEAVTEEVLNITSDSLYNYWKNKWCNDSSDLPHFKKSPILRQRYKRLSFGEIYASSENERIFTESCCLQTPKLQAQFAESVVSEYIGEIRSKASTGTIAPVSPKTSPNKLHQNLQNLSPEMRSISEKETFFDKQSYSQKLTQTIIQTSNPCRLIDRIDKEYKVPNEKSPLNIPSTFSPANNSKIKNKLKSNSSTNTSTPKTQKNVVTKTIIKKSVKRLKAHQLKLKKVNISTESNSDIKNLTVSLGANSSRRIVCSTSKNKEEVPNDNLKKSQFLIKMLPTDSSALTASKTSVTESKTDINKSNILLKKEASSNFVLKLPMTSPNVNQAEQVQKKPPSIESKIPPKTLEIISNEKMSSAVASQNKDSVAVTSPINSIQCKKTKLNIKRNFNITSSDLQYNKITPFTITLQNKNSSTVSNDSSVICKLSKPAVKRTVALNNQNLASNEKLPTTDISLNKDCNAAVPKINSSQVSNPTIKSNTKLLDNSNTIKINLSQVKVSNPILKRDTKLLDSSNATKINLSQVKVSNPILKRDTKLLGNSNATKIKLSSTSPSNSHSKSLVSFPQNKQVNMEKVKLTQSKVIDTTAPKKFKGNCNPDEFKRIIQFLKIKVALKHKHLSPDQQHQKALTLAHTFIQTNDSITKLDKRAMKMLDEFEKANV